jgi:hypothetical protein
MRVGCPQRKAAKHIGVPSTWYATTTRKIDMIINSLVGGNCWTDYQTIFSFHLAVPGPGVRDIGVTRCRGTQESGGT